MASIGSFSGLASGIQWRDMVDEIMRLEQVRQVNPLTNQASIQQRRIDAWKGFQGVLGKLASAASGLSDGSAFDTFKVSVGNSATTSRTLLSASATTSAAPGTYSVQVLDLARSEKIGGAATESATSELNMAGTFLINGRAVEVASGDSLNSVRDKINAANTGAKPSGVTATILSTGANEHRLILTSDTTGSRGIELVDSASGVLRDLGILDGTLQANSPEAGKTQTQRFASSTQSVASLLGLTDPPAVRNVVIDGREITVDLTQDTLQSILDRVQAAGGSGRMVSETAGGQTRARLEVNGAVSSAAGDADSQRIVELLGFQQGGRTNQITTGSDARIEIDGFALTRRSNTVSDALAGVTLSLQQAEVGTTVDVTVSRDQGTAITGVKAFATAYNEMLTFVRQQSAPGQPLASNGTLRAAMSSFTNVLLTPVEGVQTVFPRATLVGLSLSRTGTLEVDEAKLKETLTTNLSDVRALFAGSGDTPGLAGLMKTAADAMTRSGNGLVAGQTESLQRSVESLSRRTEDVTARLELRRESLIRQFARMEEALGRIQSQGDWLSSQIKAMRPPER
jgi:flagellar hook-associated protein 2